MPISTYDDNNIFAKILRKKIPTDFIFQSDHTVAFNDIFPKANIHILVIPRGAYMSAEDFYQKATAIEVKDFHDSILKIAMDQGISLGGGGSGYRLVTNIGAGGGQEVPHFHVHILAGSPLKSL